LPLEFRSAGFAPEPWLPEDCLSFLVFISWQMLYAHFNEKLCALASGAGLGAPEWNDIFPSSPGAVLPQEQWFSSLSRLKLGKILPAARALDTLSPDSGAVRPAAGSGSNNWVVARGADGMPLLANDPHLGIVLPATWYFCHLDCPSSPGFPEGIHAAGASVAGCPGVAIGRNGSVAWGFTSAMIDAADILILRVDPRDPLRYQVGGQERVMTREDVVLAVRGAGTLSLPLYNTVLGPAITAVEPGVEAVAVLRWFGTIPEQMLQDHTLRGLISFFTAGSAHQLLEAGVDWKWLSWNILAADTAGRIGWRTCGAAPVRRGYSGRLPADGSSGADWTGFLPYDALPHRLDPPEGWLATANQKTTENGAEAPLSYVWYGPHRHQRIAEALAAMRSPGIADFARLHADVHSLQADILVPRILAHSVEDPLAREAREILAGWDREVRTDSAGAALFESFLRELDVALLSGRFGDGVSLYSSARSGWTLADVILDRPGSPLWNGKGGPREAVERCLVSAMAVLEKRLGNNRRLWRWGRLHRYAFRHPGATSALLERLINPDALEAPGDCNTVNVAWCRTGRGSFDVTVIPSLRMIVPLADPDGMRIIGPLGQSGQPGHPHYDDMLTEWAAGRYVTLPMGRRAVEETVRDRLILAP
jgi:penicillin amidase